MKKGFDKLRGAAAASAIGLGLLGGGSARAASTTLGVTVTTANVQWQNINIGRLLNSSNSSLVTASGINLKETSSGLLIDNASLTSGISDAFDGALFMAALQSGVTTVFSNPDTTVDLTNSTLTSDVVSDFITNIDAQIEYYFHPSRSLVRALYSFENTSSSDISFKVYIGGNLLSGTSTNIQSTSDGDTTVETKDRWIISSNRSFGTDPTTGTADTPVITISRFGKDAEEPENGTQLTNGRGTFGHLYDVTVPDNSTRHIMVFVELSDDISDAEDNADDFETLEKAEAAGLLAGFISNNIDFDEIANYIEDDDDSSSGGGDDDDDDLSTGAISASNITALLVLLTLVRIQKSNK